MTVGELRRPSCKRAARDACSALTTPSASGRTSALDNLDTELLRRLSEHHAPALLRYVAGLTGDRARAEDIVQETLLKAWQHPEVVNHADRSPRAWLFTVARNMVIDERRSARFRTEFGMADPGRACDHAAADEMGCAVDRLLVSDALARLSQAQRAVIRRAYYQRWTTAEIAADLGIAEGTVKSRLHYAVRALRLALEEMGYRGASAANAGQHATKRDLRNNA